VRTACDDQVVSTLWRSALLGIPASLLLATILGPSVPVYVRVEFVALVSIADIACFAVMTHYRRRRRRGEVVERFWMGPCCAALVGLAWGSLPLLAMPDGRHVELRIAYLLFIAGISATFVVGAAARRLYYWVSQVPLVAPGAIVYMQSSDKVTRLLGVSILVYFAVMTALHRDVHGLVLSELTLRQQNEVANERLSFEATHDSLTGLANRAAFIGRLNDEFEAARGSRPHVAVLYIDVDRFKTVNDSLGHALGDQLLVEIAARMRRVLDDGALLARFGGDEFTVLLPRATSRRVAAAVAARLAAAFTEPFRLGERLLEVSASIGVAVAGAGAATPEALLSQADAAQYRAKEAGRNRVEIFDAELRKALRQRLDDEQRARRAIDNGEISAWYQPIVDLHDGRIVGAEALARWDHPDRGVLDASRFIAMVDEAGLIVALDGRIIQQAVEAATRLADAGHATAFRMWCNASAHHFARIDPAERLAQLLERAGCDGNLIGFDITETALLADAKVAARELAAARELGVKIALDDFGVGHYSLTLLRLLPFDVLKIDRSFVRDVTRDVRVDRLVSSVVSLAHALGIEPVAEGVESPEQVHVLRDFGCRYGQGYLWSKAVPFDRLVELIDVANATPAPRAGAPRDALAAPPD
jgi:diguanylate cyclase (GGDEF)-like protein